MRRRITPYFGVLALTSALTLTACADDAASGETTETGEGEDSNGDDASDDSSSSSSSSSSSDDSGDGDAGDGDAGDGDAGDGDAGDGDAGDGDSGDGDGDAGTGDGDGDAGTGDGDGDTGDGDTGGDDTVYDVACSTAGYESLCAAIDKAGLAATLDDASATFTVFAPDNDAFTALLGAVGASSLDDVTVEQLTPILLYHVLSGSEVDSTAADTVATANGTVGAIGGTIQLSKDGDDIQLDGTAIVDVPNVDASNGIVHGITAVILPSITDVVVTGDDFSSLEAALGLADTDASAPNLVGTLDDNDGTFTVFAPPNSAFASLIGALPSEAGITALTDITSTQVLPILRYHVVAGAAVTSGEVPDGAVPTLGGTVQADTSSGVSLDAATVTVADIFTANGVIHVIDSVLVPSIADTVTTAPEFSELAGLVGAADGGDTAPKVGAALDGAAGNGAWTLFAPTNAAITTLVGALGAATPSGQDLTNVLLYHAIEFPGSGVFASTAIGLNETPVLTALPGNFVVVDGGTGVSVTTGAFGAADVVTTDYLCANGVIHAINDVLVPTAASGDGLSCAGALAFEVGEQAIAWADTTLDAGTHNNDECTDAGDADDVTYALEAGVDGEMEITVVPASTAFDATIHTLTNCLDPGTGVACQNDGAAGETETLSVTGLEEGDVVNLVVDGAGGSEGEYTIIVQMTAN